MTGTVALDTGAPGWGPYAGGEQRSFERADVTAFGKLRRYGSFLTYYLVRLRDGVELFVVGTEQPADDCKWMRRIARGVPTPIGAREVGFAIQWAHLTTPEPR